MTFVIKGCRGKKRGERKIGEFRENLMIPEYDWRTHCQIKKKEKYLEIKNTWRILF